MFPTSPHAHAQRFVFVCGLVLLLIALLTTLPESSAGRSTTTVVAAIALIASAWASRVPPRFLRMLGALVASIVALSVASMIAGVGSATTANALMMLLLFIGMPVAILAGVREARTVNVQTVFAAISLYLLIGLVFAFLITVAGRLTAGPYFSQGTDGTMSERVYFSYITMGTLGYGDLTPAGDAGRLLAIFETVAGSLFLVTAVSLVVTRVGTDRTRPRDDAPTGGA
ncbi:MAG: hypothetical protein QOF68_2901 [Gaiellales bacterium]|nr:hypothetical protein [Gaiellales bacterium]